MILKKFKLITTGFQKLDDQKIAALDQQDLVSPEVRVEEKGKLEKALEFLQKEYLPLSDELDETSTKHLKLLNLIQQQSQAL